MIDLEHQIREYYEHIVVPVTLDEVGLTDGIDTTVPVPAPRRFIRPVVVAAAAVVVLLLIGLPLWLIGGRDTAPPAVEPSLTSSTSPLITETPPVVGPVEMLQIGDLPQRFDWQVYDEAQGEDAAIGAFSSGWHGLLPVRCAEEEPTGSAYGPDGEIGIYGLDLANDPVLDGLGEVWQHRALYAVANTQIVNRGTTHVVGQVVFAESPAAEPGAFDALEAEIIGCVDDQDRWSAATERGWEVGRVLMPPIGDDSAAGKWKVPMGDGYATDVFRVAIVRQGTHLLLVESHEYYRNSLEAGEGYVPLLTDSEFAAVVEAAANRLVAATDDVNSTGEE